MIRPPMPMVTMVLRLVARPVGLRVVKPGARAGSMPAQVAPQGLAGSAWVRVVKPGARAGSTPAQVVPQGLAGPAWVRVVKPEARVGRPGTKVGRLGAQVVLQGLAGPPEPLPCRLIRSLVSGTEYWK